MEQKTDHKSRARRKYPRHKAPKGLFVGWKTAGQRTVSRADTIGLGGLFLHTPNPPSEGSMIELLFDLKAGEVRARAMVKHSAPGKGMGVQFIQMQSPDRARLSQFLSQYATTQNASDAQDGYRGAAARISAARNQPAPGKAPEAPEFERDLQKILDIARKGTYYQLLAITPDSAAKDIRQSFHRFARKYHPDYHMSSPQWMAALKELMATATSAYKVLMDEEKRAGYDAHLNTSGAYTLQRTKSSAQETVEQCFAHANENLRAGNFVGSIVWLRKCTEMSPREARYHALLARSLSDVEQYRNEAIAEFQRAIDLDPWNTAVYMEFAEICETMKLSSRARALYSKVLEINPVHAEAQKRLAELNAQPAGAPK